MLGPCHQVGVFDIAIRTACERVPTIELEQPDRDHRESIWRRIADRRMEASDELETLFDRLLDACNRLSGRVDDPGHCGRDGRRPHHGRRRRPRSGAGR